MRLQLALNVKDLDAAIAFYSKMFSVAPHKRRDGYANFEVAEPPLKLVLFENPDAAERLNHLGVEVFDAQAVAAAEARLAAANLVSEVERGTTCCHATQDKVWAREPDGLRWEWYQITDDAPSEPLTVKASGCCAESGPKDACCG